MNLSQAQVLSVVRKWRDTTLFGPGALSTDQNDARLAEMLREAGAVIPDRAKTEPPATLMADPEAVEKLQAMWDSFFPGPDDSSVWSDPHEWTYDQFLTSFKNLADRVLKRNERWPDTRVPSPKELQTYVETGIEPADQAPGEYNGWLAKVIRELARQEIGKSDRRRELVELAGKLAVANVSSGDYAMKWSTLTGDTPEELANAQRQVREAEADHWAGLSAAILDAVDRAVVKPTEAPKLKRYTVHICGDAPGCGTEEEVALGEWVKFSDVAEWLAAREGGRK